MKMYKINDSAPDLFTVSLSAREHATQIMLQLETIGSAEIYFPVSLKCFHNSTLRHFSRISLHNPFNICIISVTPIQHR